MKKDPGIPNLFPYRDKIIHEIEETRRIKAEEAENRRAESKARLASVVGADVDGREDEPKDMALDDDKSLGDGAVAGDTMAEVSCLSERLISDEYG